MIIMLMGMSNPLLQEIKLEEPVRQLLNVDWAGLFWLFFTTLIILFIGLLFIRLAKKFLNKLLLKAGFRRTVNRLLITAVKFILYFVLAIILVDHLGFATSSLLALLGSCGLALGLALQGSLSDLAAGILLVVLNPFQTGDYVYIGDRREELLQVVEIRLFQTTFRNNRGFRVIMPNSKLTKDSIVNLSVEDKVLAEAEVQVSYDAVDEEVRAVINAAMDKVASISKDNRSIFVTELAANGVSYKARGQVAAEDYFKSCFALRTLLKSELAAAGIEIPYPQIVVHQARTEEPSTEIKKDLTES